MYIISKQGNRNLVLQYAEQSGEPAVAFNSLDEAKAEARRRASRDKESWFVFGVEPVLRFTYRSYHTVTETEH